MIPTCKPAIAWNSCSSWVIQWIKLSLLSWVAHLWPCLPITRDYFIRNLHDALSGHRSNSVTEAVRYSERSVTKCVGITIETRPDYCLKRHLSDMLLYGCTRLEIGVQSVYEDVARDTNRGHTVRAVCESFQLAKDAGFKVVAHMMPDLPNVGLERDLEQFQEVL